MRKKILIAPSMLSADFSRLGDEAKRMEQAGADMLHIDVMDGHFVPNITIGPVVVEYVKKCVRIPLDVHLMISEPEKYSGRFIQAGADILTFHIEAHPEPAALIEEIKKEGARPGLVINPPTPFSKLQPYCKCVDFVLIMSVNPGFAGQKFINSALDKARALRKIYDKDIEIDGGINYETAKQATGAGVNVLVAGSFIFGKKDARQIIKKLRETAND